jgi:mRNA interferase MazF
VKGHEQGKRRPALVISPAAYNRRAELCIACPITSKAKGYPFEVALPPGHGATGVVLADQVRSLSWVERNIEITGNAPVDTLAEVRAKLATVTGIDP